MDTVGFREGDIVEIQTSSWNNSVQIRIDKFVENNTKVEYTLIKGPVTTQSGTATNVGLYQKNPEIEGILSVGTQLGMLDILIETYSYTKHLLIQRQEHNRSSYVL